MRSIKLNFSKGNNCVSDEGLEYLSKALSKCEYLQEVGLKFIGEHNEITESGGKKFDYLKEKIKVF